MSHQLSRRSYLLSQAGLASLAAQTPGPRAAVKQPNIIWILGEDMSPQLGCYGEPLIQTPNLDAMARAGIRFQNAFTTAPVCSPSRSAIATGMYQTTIGAHNHRTINKQPLPSGVRHISHYLREARYFTVLCGAAPGAKKDPARGNGSLGTPKTDYNFAVENPFDGYDWNQRPAGKPFFAQLTLQESHKGIGWPLGRKETPNIDQSKLKLAPYVPDHPVARDEVANYLEAIQMVDKLVGEIFARLEREKILDDTLVIFMGDNGSCLFRGKQFLYEGGIRVPLLMRWPGHIAPGTVRNDLVSAIDVTAAVLGAAGVPIPATMQGRDLLAKDHTPREFIYSARDRCDIAIERMRCVRDTRYKYIRNFLPGMPYMQSNPYKEKEYPTWNLVKQLYREGKLDRVQALFAAEGKPIEELYDLQADPHEINNLAVDVSQRDRLANMRKLLDKVLTETGDKGSTMEDPVEIYRSFFGAKF